ncbi:MAG: hydrogenase maturation nickel metallochaperone HypA [Chloroflexi bacterium]|nr:hydrogenase maturation nickel metallochaperone HypA [Chloroflexota bacterium]
MHELSLTQTLLDLALKNADGRRIVSVNLLLGELSDERPEAIRFYWNDVARGTLAENAELRFRPVTAKMKCLQCSTVFHPEETVVECPNCKSFRVKILSGDDIRLAGIDVK